MIPVPCALRRLFAGAALAAGLVAATPAAAEPALWAVRDADSTIYLFGTVHVLRPGLNWRSAKLAKAIEASGDLTLEIEPPKDDAQGQALMIRHGMDREGRLSSKLAPADAGRLAAAARTLGLPPEGLEPMRPWFAAMVLSLVPLMQAGYDGKSGVEEVLAAQARASGKPIGQLESLEQQLGFFSSMPEVAQVEMLLATLDDIDGGAAQLDAMVAAWSAGDVGGLETAFISEMRRDYAPLYDLLVVKRNRAWADQLVEKLKGSGVSFVAVGAGHLVGPDSVQVELARRGVFATRE